MDKRAVEVLSKAFWSPAGWRKGGASNASAEDFKYAKQHGVMFDDWRTSHREVISELVSVVAATSLQMVSRAFVASLSSRLPHRRSAFGSFSVFRNFAAHEKVGKGAFCEYCGGAYKGEAEDLNVLSFERVKWGGVRHVDPLYALFDLRQFSKEYGPEPNTNDVSLLNALVRSLRSAPVGTTASAIQRNFPKSVGSNKSERDVIVQLFGFAGILRIPEQPGFNKRFIRHCDRVLPDRHFVDMAYPAAWWNSAKGLNEEALRECFGQYLEAGV